MTIKLPEPTAYLVISNDGAEFAADYWDGAQDHINDAVSNDVDGARSWRTKPVYTSDQVRYILEQIAINACSDKCNFYATGTEHAAEIRAIKELIK